ncbi:MAG: fibronectin type III-like domain-contianing protein, partial [Roseburia sp.]|nr:fibronectin type III-like domain-contianing protein [Roseburia sp.]
DGKYELKVRVENLEETPGREVVQLYYTPPYTNGGIEKAAMNLLAFGKTEVLSKGQSQVLTLSFSAYDLASFDDYDKNGNEFAGYELEHGTYKLKLMSNSHDAHDCYNVAGAKISNTIDLTCAEDIRFEQDPTTGKDVVTRFTGSTAYGSTPVDGTTANANIKYLSRNNRFENFSSITRYNATASKNTTNEVYDNEDISDIKFGIDAGLYLITDTNGNKVSLAALKGQDTGVDLEYNIDLMLELADYDNEEKWNQFLNQISKTETLDLIGMGGFQTIAIGSLGKPRCEDLDGPAGFSPNSVTRPNASSDWTAFPSEALIGCSWSQRLLYNMGRAQGAIASATGLNGWYGPGVNLHRSPYNSRNFEYYSEDGLLSGKLAAEVIRGAKQANTYCYIKHFAASEAGENPGNWYTWLTEQSLRENYLRPFEIAVKEGGANAIMSAFNRVGKDWVGRNAALSIDVLRTEWGFKGTMITDWYNSGFMNYRAGVLGGNDLWLDGTSQKAATGFDLDNNKSDIYATRRSVKNILYTYIDTYVTAYEYAEYGDPNDPYKVEIDSINMTAEPFSGLFVALWVIIDVLIVGGIAVCVLFFFLTQREKKPKTVNAESSSDE